MTAFNALFFAQDPDEAFAEAVRVSRDYVVVCQWHPELTIDIPQVHPDEATTLRSFLSVGSHQRISEGEEEVAEKIRAAVEPFRTQDGGYRFSNKYLMSVFRKDQAASTS
ncbi:hypothetical protein AB0M48_27040 [Lentzea sp. NPDC051208]|uniref:hypothetical protein n=1 Tax=Lentzea sp. NPDC051208 TaxID=3154642 RepID=UPI00342A0C8F